MTVKHRAQCKSSGQRDSTRHPSPSSLPKSQSNVFQIAVVALLRGVHSGPRGLHVGVLENLTARAAELIGVGRRVEHLMARRTLQHRLEVDRDVHLYLRCRLLVLRVHLLLSSVLRRNVLVLLIGLVVGSVLLGVVHLRGILLRVLLRVHLLLLRGVLLVGLHHALSS